MVKIIDTGMFKFHCGIMAHVPIADELSETERKDNPALYDLIKWEYLHCIPQYYA